MRSRPFAVLAVVLGAASVLSSAASAVPRVRSEVRQRIAAEGRARVIVAFGVPGSPEPIALGRTASERAAVRATARRILDRLAPGEFEVARDFEGLGALAGIVSEAGLAHLLEDPTVYAVGLDRELHPALAESVPLVRLAALHVRGLTGTGSKLAIGDGGVDTDHPDLAGDLVDQACFCSTMPVPCCPDGTSWQTGPGSAEDDDGHGTAVAGIVGSDGIVAPVGGAPSASLVVAKLSGGATGGFLASDVLAAGDWVLREHLDTDAINLSFGGPDGLETPCDDYDGTTAIGALLVNALKAQGTLAVASAMNEGRPDGLGIPACLSGVIAVGATYDDGPLVDQVTDFSNRDAAIALMAPGAWLDTSGLGGGVTSFGGTSASAPLVSACVAVLRQAVPDATADQLRAALTTSPTIVTDDVTGREWPRLDCEAALVALPEPGPAVLLAAGALVLLLVRAGGGVSHVLRRRARTPLPASIRAGRGHRLTRLPRETRIQPASRRLAAARSPQAALPSFRQRPVVSLCPKPPTRRAPQWHCFVLSGVGSPRQTFAAGHSECICKPAEGGPSETSVEPR